MVARTRLNVTLCAHCLSCSDTYSSDHLHSSSVLLIQFRYNVPHLWSTVRAGMARNCNVPSHRVCGTANRLLQPFSAALLCEPNLHVRSSDVTQELSVSPHVGSRGSVRSLVPPTPIHESGFKHNQQDATSHNDIYYYKWATSFRRFLRPSSGAQNCIHSIGYLSSFYCFLPLAHAIGKKQ